MQTRCEVVERKTTIVESHYGSFSFFFFILFGGGGNCGRTLMGIGREEGVERVSSRV